MENSAFTISDHLENFYNEVFMDNDLWRNDRIQLNFFNLMLVYCILKLTEK